MPGIIILLCTALFSCTLTAQDPANCNANNCTTNSTYRDYYCSYQQHPGSNPVTPDELSHSGKRIFIKVKVITNGETFTQQLATRK